MSVRKLIFLGDLSVESLYFFLVDSDFLKEDCDHLGYRQYVQTVVNFIERILNFNGARYQNLKDALTFDEIGQFYQANKPRKQSQSNYQNNSNRGARGNSNRGANTNNSNNWANTNNSNNSRPSPNPNAPKGKQFIYTPEEIERKGQELCHNYNRVDNRTGKPFCTNPVERGKCKDKQGRLRLHQCSWQFHKPGDNSYCCQNHAKYEHKKLTKP